MPVAPKTMHRRACRPWHRRWLILSRASFGCLWSRAMRLWENGEAGNSPGADTGGYALIKVRDGAVLADGDEVFTNRDAAVEAFTRARALGWDLYATPGLLAGGADRDVTELDVSSLAAVPENVLRRAPFTRIGRAHLALVLLLPAAIAGVWIAWLQRDALLDWIAGPEPVVAAAPSTDPDLAVAVDSVALIEACRRALIDYPPWVPAWRTESLTCAARFSDPELAALRPELAGRAVMLVRWRLAPRPRRAAAPPTRRATSVEMVRRVRGRCEGVGGPPAGPRAAHRRDRAAPIPGVSPCCRPRAWPSWGADRLLARPTRRLDRPDRLSRPVVPPCRSIPRGRRPRWYRDHRAGSGREWIMAPAWPPGSAGGDDACGIP